MMTPDQLASAFNAGSDARIAGRPRSSNPCLGRNSNGCKTYWYLGWDDVDRHWGLGSRRPVQVLCQIRE